MAHSEDVLPLSEHLHGVLAGWPTQRRPETALCRLTGMGRILDEVRRLARELEQPDATWPEQKQPVGVLYREEGVHALRSCVDGLLERSREFPGRTELLAQLHPLRESLRRAAETTMPLLRLYQYAEEEPAAIVTIVSARKSFVYWDTQMEPESSDFLPDITALWTVGEALEPEASASAVSLRASAGVLVAQLARATERRSREREVSDDPTDRQHASLDALLAWDARLARRPSVATVLPSRAEILWAPRRLDLVDVKRLVRWLHHQALGPHATAMLSGALAFIERAGHENAALLLDAFCTDSPEAG